MIAAPFDTGADHDTTTDWFAAVTDGFAGVPGTPAGVTGSDAGEAEPVPAALVAATVNVYAVPFVNPVTVHDKVLVVQVAPPGVAVAV